MCAFVYINYISKCVLAYVRYGKEGFANFIPHPHDVVVVVVLANNTAAGGSAIIISQKHRLIVIIN